MTRRRPALPDNNITGQRRVLITVRSAVLLPLLLLSLGLPARAAEHSLPDGSYHEALAYDAFPDARGPGGSWTGLFPNLEAQALSQLSYFEHSAARQMNLAAVGVSGRPQAQLSLVYYSPGGYAYLLRRALPLPRIGRLYAQLLLPAAEQNGAIRVLLWDKQPDAEVLAALMQWPNRAGAAVPGVVGQYWLARQPASAAVLPWLDSYDSLRLPPLGFRPDDWPYCYARLDSAGHPVLKDCVLSSTAREVLDPLGLSRQAWELRWGDELLLSFALPRSRITTQAVLLLDSSPAGDYSSAGSSPAPQPLVVEVNGWETGQFDLNPPGIAQPGSLNVSHYLRPGVNQVRVRAPAVSSQSWVLRSVELWLD